MGDDLTPRFTPKPWLGAYAWDYLHRHRPEPVHDVDPAAELGQHEDDLPADWRIPAESVRPTVLSPGIVDVPTWDRVDDALDRAVHFAYNALFIAGFTYAETREFEPLSDINGILRWTMAAMWEFRRFGFPLESAQRWHQAGLTPAVAKVYDDAGYQPSGAARFHDAARAHFNDIPLHERNFRPARAELALLDHRLTYRRAIAYIAAGIHHHEIPDWETRRLAGEPIDETLDTMVALNGLARVPSRFPPSRRGNRTEVPRI